MTYFDFTASGTVIFAVPLWKDALPTTVEDARSAEVAVRSWTVPPVPSTVIVTECTGADFLILSASPMPCFRPPNSALS